MRLKQFFANFAAMVRWNALLLAFTLPLMVCAAMIALALLSGEGVGLAALPLMLLLIALSDVGSCGVSATFRRMQRAEAATGEFLRTLRRRGLTAALLSMTRSVTMVLLLWALRFYAGMGVPLALVGVAGGMLALMLLAMGEMLIPALAEERPWRDGLQRAISAGLWHFPGCAAAMLLTLALPCALLSVGVAGIALLGLWLMICGLSLRVWAYTSLMERLDDDK